MKHVLELLLIALLSCFAFIGCAKPEDELPTAIAPTASVPITTVDPTAAGVVASPTPVTPMMTAHSPAPSAEPLTYSQALTDEELVNAKNAAIAFYANMGFTVAPDELQAAADTQHLQEHLWVLCRGCYCIQLQQVWYHKNNTAC